MMPLSYGMIFHMIYAVLQISPVSKVDSKPTISEIIPTIASYYRTPDRLPGNDSEHV